MGIIDIFINASVMFRKSSVTFCNDPQRFRTFCNVTQCSVMLWYALHKLQLPHAVGECILRCGGSDTDFPDDFGEDLFNLGHFSAAGISGEDHRE